MAAESKPAEKGNKLQDMNKRQTELERQNAELRAVQSALEEALEKQRLIEAVRDHYFSILQSTAQSCSEGHLVVDLKGSTVFFNRRFLELWRIPQELASSRDDEAMLAYVMDQLVDPAEFIEHVRTLYSDYSACSLDTIHFKDGRVFERSSRPQVLQGEIVGRVWSFRDLTESRLLMTEKLELESRNQQMQKKASLNRMAGAIAHSFNNMLTSVMGNLELAMNLIPDGGEPVKRIEAALKAAGRAAEISRQMLLYIGQSNGNSARIDLSALVSQLVALQISTMPEGVSMESSLAADEVAVFMDLGQIQLVLDNLLSNAREALPGGNGKIRVAVSRAFAADIPQVRRFPLDWRPDKELYACIEVADSGSGMNDSEISNIFDPFYSTKFIGRGMGLSVVLGVVISCNGVVTVSSEKGKGSSIKVYIPLMATAPAQQCESVGSLKDSCKGATILLVEDDEVVRQTTAAMLDCLGFSVIEAEDGGRAMDLLQENFGAINLVLSDLVMPRLDGWGVLAGVRLMNSDIPVILASGFDEEHVFAGEHPEMPYCMLRKPFRMTELKSVLSSALANHAPAAA